VACIVIASKDGYGCCAPDALGLSGITSKSAKDSMLQNKPQ